MNKTTILLSQNWRFHYGDESDAWQSWYDDSSWQLITVPHDWSVKMPFSRDHSSGTGYLAGGIGWYRLHIAPDPSLKGKHVSIVFDGIYKNSRIWCNNICLGERPNGYLFHSYDITNLLHFDQENVIAVYVDHRELSDSRWFTGSGITRKVTLVIEEPLHLIHCGSFFTTPTVTEEKADFLVISELSNTTMNDYLVTVTNSLIYCGYVASSSSETVQLPAGKVTVVPVHGSIDKPKLWSTECPHLYTLETILSYHNGQQLISFRADSMQVGIRSFHFDPDMGFFLNGQSQLIKGVCIHHDAGCLGGAVYKEVWHRRLTKLKTMGCNAIRMSHNPHMPELYDLCDELGFLVMDEAFDEWEAPKNKWVFGHNVYPPRHEGYYVNWHTWHQRDLTDLIRRDRNHPSIILWSIGNEIDYPNDPYCHSGFDIMLGNNDYQKPESELKYHSARPDTARLALLCKELRELVMESDTTRPVTVAAAFPELSANLGFIDEFDVVGFNYKESLYEENHLRFPLKSFLGSENGHSLDAWKAVTDYKYISGQFLWTGIDYLGEARGWPIHGSSSGLLTLAGFEKPDFFRRQSFWSISPVIHLTSMRADEYKNEFCLGHEVWNYIKGEDIIVKCFTNLQEIELLLNDRSLGIFSKENNQDAIIIHLSYEPGTLTAKATSNEHQHISYTLETTGCACQIKLSSYDNSTNVKQIEVEVADSLGRLVSTDSTLLNVTVEGGLLLGIENGDLSDITDYASHSRRAYHGKLLIYACTKDNLDMPMTITVQGENLRTSSIIV